MDVKLLSHTANPKEIVAIAGKLCYSSKRACDIGLTGSEVNEFINKLISLGHESPLEHVSFTFAVDGISRACSHQLVRHRIASYSQKSQRYVDESEFSYVIPPSILNDDDASEEFVSLMADINNKYASLKNLLMEKGIDRKMAQEDARYVLPNATGTNLVVTMNIRSLLNFISLRACDRAQWEIRSLALRMRSLLIEVLPEIFERSGPSCLSGVCSEGRMSCGKPWSGRELIWQNL